jgi:hypothetical protein
LPGPRAHHDHGLEEQAQDAKALGDEEQVPDRIKECHRALDLGRGHGLALDRRRRHAARPCAARAGWHELLSVRSG